MKRRVFIIVLATSVLALGSWWLINFINGLFASPAPKPEALSLILSDKDLRSIGESYRNDFPGEASEEKLLEKLRAGSTGSAAIPDDYNERITEDFKKGQVVVINGWVLSVTEARQCALFSLAA